MTIVFNQENIDYIQFFSIRNFHYDDEIYMYFKVVKPHKDNITICIYVEILQHIWFDFFYSTLLLKVLSRQNIEKRLRKKTKK